MHGPNAVLVSTVVDLAEIPVAENIAATGLSPWCSQNQLPTLHSMPGCVRLVEALLRTDCTSTLHSSSTAIAVTGNGLAITMTTGAHLTKYASVASLPACISLATTLRKVLLKHKQVQDEMKQEEPEYMQWCSNAINSYRDAVDHLVEATKLSQMAEIPRATQHTPDPIISENVLETTVEARLRRKQLFQKDSQCASSRYEPAVYENNTTSVQTLLQRSTAVVALLVTSFNDFKDAVVLGIPSQNLRWGVMLDEKRLVDVMVEICAASQQTTLNATSIGSLIFSTWGQYAMSCRGSLLNGCCNLDCTNLSCVSEDVLPTQVCAGCRRVRYCSVHCQQAAWLGGGHSLLCGKRAVVHESIKVDFD